MLTREEIIEKLVEGKYSIGKVANLVEMPLSEFMDIIANLGIKSKINAEDVLEGYENLSKVLN